MAPPRPPRSYYAAPTRWLPWPWLDALGLSFASQIYLPVSRGWAAACAAEEDVARFRSDVGIDVPAHRDAKSGEYVIDYPFPWQYDPDAKRWLFDEPITWDQVGERWKARARGRV